MEDNENAAGGSTPVSVPAPLPTTAVPSAQRSESSALRERMLDLVALLALLAFAALVFIVAGPAAFTAVTGVGVGLFTAWRTHPPRR